MKTNTRNILAYFIESKIWKTYETSITNNISYWHKEDQARADRMWNAKYYKGDKGYTVKEYIYDMIDCVFLAKLKDKTKDRLYTALDDLEKYHVDNKTLWEKL